MDSMCRNWAKDGLCTENNEYMMKNCKYSCNRCIQKEAKGNTPSNELSPPPPIV